MSCSHRPATPHASERHARCRRWAPVICTSRQLIVAILLLVVSGLAACSHTIYVGPRFYTGHDAMAHAEAIEVDSDGKIVALYAHATAVDGRDVVRLPGRFALPGLHDAHLHLMSIGRTRERVDLRGVRSPQQLRDRVAAFAVKHPSASVITGRGWDQSRWPSRRFPSWRDLEGATDKPVLVRRVDGHAALANRAMMRLARISEATKTPPGGKILRDDKGKPTGVFIDRAMALVRSKQPPPSPADRRRWLIRGASDCAAAGMTAVHDMGTSIATLTAMVHADAQRPLPLRVLVYLDGDDPASLPWLQEHRGHSRILSPRITVMGIKLFADGAMGSRGAALLEPYSDAPGTTGLTIMSEAQLKAHARQIHDAGGQVAIHAIGDRGNRMALNALQHAQGSQTGRRHRIEHAQLVHDEDLPRFAALGVTASMQPTHATSDMRWAKARVGEVRLKGAYGWRRMLQSGALLAFGSDAPVEDEQILRGLHAATTRTDSAGLPAGGWRPDQKLTDREAIAAFTMGPARAVGRGKELGKLAVGYLFDATLVDSDPRGQPGAWLRTKVKGTISGGKLIVIR